MAEPLVLTFAEIEFLLQPHPQRAATIRQKLKLTPQSATDIVAAAGLASLIARGLCTHTVADGVRPTEPIVLTSLGLANAETYTEAVSWMEDRPLVMHIFSSAKTRLGLLPGSRGLYTVEMLDARVPLADPVLKLLDKTATGPKAALAVKSGLPGREVSIAIARDDEGAWFVSDSQRSPEKGQPTTRDAAVARLAELLGAGTAA